MCSSNGVGSCLARYARFLLANAFLCLLCRAQELQPISPDATKQCVQPPPMVRWQEYDGPFQKLVGSFSQTLERQSVRPPHYKPERVLCSLGLKDKFMLFAHDSYEPLSLLTAGFGAAYDQVENNDRKFGQGAVGYGRRFGANLADQTSLRFFGEFVYPAMLAEDPRYFRMGHGGGKARFLHALGHTFIARRDNGDSMFNYAEWLGAASAAALGRTYHTSGGHGVVPIARSAGCLVGEDFGFNVLREFWPDIAHKLKMPFRDMRGAQFGGSVANNRMAPP